METKHTKGQWNAHGNVVSVNTGPGPMRTRVATATYTTSGTIVDTVTDKREAYANAKLIAAAPDMLNALTEVMEFYKDRSEQVDLSMLNIDKVITALKKATN
jgi:hypothetical protein